MTFLGVNPSDGLNRSQHGRSYFVITHDTSSQSGFAGSGFASGSSGLVAGFSVTSVGCFGGFGGFASAGGFVSAGGRVAGFVDPLNGFAVGFGSTAGGSTSISGGSGAGAGDGTAACASAGTSATGAGGGGGSVEGGGWTAAVCAGLSSAGYSFTNAKKPAAITAAAISSLSSKPAPLRLIDGYENSPSGKEPCGMVRASVSRCAGGAVGVRVRAG